MNKLEVNFPTLNQNDVSYDVEEYVFNVSKAFGFTSFNACCYNCKSKFDLSTSNKELINYLHKAGFKLIVYKENQNYKGEIRFQCPKCKETVILYFVQININDENTNDEKTIKGGKMSIKLPKISPDKFFRDKNSMIEFILLYLDGSQQNNLLGITRIHYSDRDLADQWFEDIKNNINTNTQTGKLALKEAERIYNRLIERP